MNIYPMVYITIFIAFFYVDVHFMYWKYNTCTFDTSYFLINSSPIQYINFNIKFNTCESVSKYIFCRRSVITLPSSVTESWDTNVKTQLLNTVNSVLDSLIIGMG